MSVGKYEIKLHIEVVEGGYILSHPAILVTPNMFTKFGLEMPEEKIMIEQKTIFTTQEELMKSIPQLMNSAITFAMEDNC